MSARDAARVDAQQARPTIITSLVTLYGRLAYEYAKHDLLQARQSQADQLDAILRTREVRGIDSSDGAQPEHIEQGAPRMQLLANDDSITQTQLQIVGEVVTHRFPEMVINDAVPWYFRFQLSLRDSVELLV